MPWVAGVLALIALSLTPARGHPLSPSRGPSREHTRAGGGAPRAAAVLLAAGIVAPTTAAWKDSTLVRASAAASTWSPPPIPNPGGVVGTGDEHLGHRHHLGDAVVAGRHGLRDDRRHGTSPTAKAWSVTLALAGAPFFGAPVSSLYYQGSTQVVIAQGGSSSVANVSLSGTAHRSTPITATVCSPRRSRSRSRSARRAPALRGCLELLVHHHAGGLGQLDGHARVRRGHREGLKSTSDWPFFYGWQGTANLTAAKAAIVAAGKTVNYVAWSPDPGGATSSRPRRPRRTPSPTPTRSRQAGCCRCSAREVRPSRPACTATERCAGPPGPRSRRRTASRRPGKRASRSSRRKARIGPRPFGSLRMMPPPDT